ncbi:Nef-associated protein 1 [Trachymyrmex septentrionalis]|uniref:Nef-associated protein 1 n=1 Tax=Trachymyrmex septentrionalis TaxID=34720 RepID=A0A195FE00_9HYME|nr:Nef-associated protein 1 [Trachymyrmex septentrionalis]
MDLNCRNSSISADYLLGQLNTARQEINNLRQQVKSLRYILDKDVDNIKRLLELQKHGGTRSQSKLISSEEAKPGTSKDQDVLKLKPIGVISTWFPNKRATPRQPGICGKVPGKLTLYNSIFTNPDHALQGLQDFSHMWILFHFHRNDSTHTRAKVAPPRLNGIRTGVFSTRSPHRPCPIGLSLVKILKIENHTIYFEGVDMVNQTPVLDIKPYIPQYDNGPSTVCGTDIDLVNRHVLHARVDNSPVRMGIREAPDGEEGLESQTLTPSHTLPDIHAATAISSTSINAATESNFSDIRIPDWISQPRTATLSVIFNERALMQLNEILDDKVDEQKQAIENVLREDPRSVYLRQRWGGNQFYTFLIHDLHITCRFDDSRGIVTVFQVRHAGRTCDCGEPEWQCLGHSPLS